jgi:hypothetical protein
MRNASNCLPRTGTWDGHNKISILRIGQSWTAVSHILVTVPYLRLTEGGKCEKVIGNRRSRVRPLWAL